MTHSLLQKFLKPESVKTPDSIVNSSAPLETQNVLEDNNNPLLEPETNDNTKLNSNVPSETVKKEFRAINLYLEDYNLVRRFIEDNNIPTISGGMHMIISNVLEEVNDNDQ